MSEENNGWKVPKFHENQESKDPRSSINLGTRNMKECPMGSQPDH